MVQELNEVFEDKNHPSVMHRVQQTEWRLGPNNFFPHNVISRGKSKKTF